MVHHISIAAHPRMCVLTVAYTIRHTTHFPLTSLVQRMVLLKQ